MGEGKQGRKKDPTAEEIRFAANLRAAIAASGKSLTDLTLETRLNSSQIGHYQTAGRMPSADRAGRLARAVGLTVDDLLYSESPEAVAALVEEARREWEGAATARLGAKDERTFEEMRRLTRIGRQERRTGADRRKDAG